jgi:hypothetical protein
LPENDNYPRCNNSLRYLSSELYWRTMNLGNIARVVAVTAACVAAVGSATSNNNSPAVQPQNANMSPPPPQEMDASRALGLWRSTFGAVKIEADNSRGGIASGAVQGIWVYQRRGQEVVGYFSGSMRGNVLDFRWNEPGSADSPPLVGAGYLVFEQSGRQYSGRWWSDKRDRVGDWNGWRQANAAAPMVGGYGGNAYGGQTYGQNPYGPQPQQQPYPGQQPYPAQQPQSQQQPYPGQQPQQPPYPGQQPATQPYPGQQPQQQQPYPNQQPQPQQPRYPQQQPAPQQPQQPQQQPYYPQQPQPYYPPPR